MENTVTISVAEYDSLRETKKEAHRLSLIKEPKVDVFFGEQNYKSWFDRGDFKRLYSLKVSIEAPNKELYKKVKDIVDNNFSPLISEIKSSIDDVSAQNIELIKTCTRQDNEIKALSELLDKIPNWVKRWYGAIDKK